MYVRGVQYRLEDVVTQIIPTPNIICVTVVITTDAVVSMNTVFPAVYNQKRSVFLFLTIVGLAMQGLSKSSEKWPELMALK